MPYCYVADYEKQRQQRRRRQQQTQYYILLDDSFILIDIALGLHHEQSTVERGTISGVFMVGASRARWREKKGTVTGQLGTPKCNSNMNICNNLL